MANLALETRPMVVAKPSVVDSIDMSKVMRKLCLSITAGGAAWTMERAERAVFWYRRFLHFISLCNQVVPIGDIDEVWHTHILFTEQYCDDCQLIFGRYLHHRPSDGSAETELYLQECLVSTTIIFSEFGKEFTE